jgi:anthranilate 1,2-dioxygenase small subunit
MAIDIAERQGKAFQLLLKRAAIEALLVDCARALDDDRLEDWTEFFVDDAVYEVLSRENYDQGLNAPIIYHYSKNMLKDRVMALRDALTYEPTVTRHLISNITILGESGDVADVSSNYALYQTTLEGRTRLFGVGRYIDRVSTAGPQLRFKRRSVLVDTFAISNNLAVPI